MIKLFKNTPYQKVNDSFSKPLIKICAGFLTSTLLLTGYFYIAIFLYQFKTQELEKRNFLYVKIIGLQKSFSDMEKSFRGFVLEEDKKLLEPFKRLERKIKSETEIIYKNTMFDYSIQKQFRQNLASFKVWKKFADSNIQKIINNEDRIPADHRTKEGEKLSSKILESATLLTDKLEVQLSESRTEMSELQKWGFLGSVFLILLIAFIFFIFLYKEFKTAISSYQGLVSNLADKKMEADSALKAKDLFLANMSHEIRTPLGSIIGFSEIIENSETLSSTGKSHISFIRKNSKYLLTLINDLFDISKITNNKVDVVNETIDLRSFILDIKNVFMSKSDDKRIELNFRQSTSIPENIVSDPVRLKQIISNLVANAIKFSDKNTTVQVIFSHRKNEFFVDIIDEGIGIKPELVNSIFTPFVQGDLSHSRSYGGAGLGLALSKKLATVINGELTLVSSKENIGSHFRLALNVGNNSSKNILESDKYLEQSNESSTEQEQSMAVDVDLTSKRVLLAEDAKENQMLFKIYIDSTGADLTIVGNGTEAISEALNNNNNHFDVILMDLQMPGMGGYEAIRALRNSDYEGKVIALTAHALKGEREKCLNAGFDDYISKPVSKKKLIAKISQYAGLRVLPQTDLNSTKDVLQNLNIASKND